VSHKEGSEGLDFGAYVAAVDDVPGEFDLIVVDGRAREACYARALDRLAPGGMIVFDNVDRQRYVDAIEASHRPVEVLWTRGLTPSLPYPTRTALIRLAAH
jgi:predicted O-methyltransferase YrrM